MNNKSLYNISWQVSEEEYRKDSALSYSTIARYEREGFNNLDKLFDKVDSPSLTFGSAVDSIITGGMEEFNERFMVANTISVPDSIIKIVKKLFSIYKERIHSLEDISNDTIINITQEESYQLNWRPETRAKVIKEKGSEYYNLLYEAGNRVIIDNNTYQDVLKAVKTLKESKATEYYFKEDDIFDDTIKRYYQLKFKTTLNGIEYRCMLDGLIVNNRNKTIQPIDLKTSCKRNDREWDFHKHYLEWGYQIQNRLYFRILQDIISKDDVYKDYIILPYKDIIIFRGSDTPLVWNIPFTNTKGTLYLGKNKQIELRDPEEIGQELYYYLRTGVKMPNGINEFGDNNIEEYINKL